MGISFRIRGWCCARFVRHGGSQRVNPTGLVTSAVGQGFDALSDRGGRRLVLCARIRGAPDRSLPADY